MKTGYSNGAPRMKLVKTEPIKQSIPGIVNLNYDANGLLTIYPETEGNKFEGLYKSIYLHNDTTGTPFYLEDEKVDSTEIKNNSL